MEQILFLISSIVQKYLSNISKCYFFSCILFFMNLMIPIVILVLSHIILYTPFFDLHSTVKSFFNPLLPKKQILICGSHNEPSHLIIYLQYINERLTLHNGNCSTAYPFCYYLFAHYSNNVQTSLYNVLSLCKKLLGTNFITKCIISFLILGNNNNNIP